MSQNFVKWIKERPQTLRYLLTVVMFVLVLILLLLLTLRLLGLSEVLNGLSLNLLSEIIGALLVTYLLEGTLKQAARARTEEMAELKRGQERLEQIIIDWQKLITSSVSSSATVALENLPGLENLMEILEDIRHNTDTSSQKDKR